MVVQYERRMAAILHDFCCHMYAPTSNTAIAMITMRKSIHGTPFLSYMHMVRHLCSPLGHWSSAINAAGSGAVGSCMILTMFEGLLFSLIVNQLDI